MPIYQYICLKCGYSWDKLIKNSELRIKNAKQKCPRCHSNKTEKAMTSFASFGIGEGCAPSSCSGCPGCK